MESEFSKAVRRGLQKLAQQPTIPRCRKPDCLICMMEARHRNTIGDTN